MSGTGPAWMREGRVRLSPAHLRGIARILQDEAGIALGEESERLIVSRLSKRLRGLGFDGFDAYLALVSGAAGAAERRHMVNALTTNTTRFFREAGHFDILAAQVIPRLARKARTGGRVRLWSAACSTGEEAYSLAATLLEAFPEAPRFDVKILATDINDLVLERAEAGLFEPSCARGLSQAHRHCLFEAKEEGGRLRIRGALRDLVSFRYLNLVGPWPVSGPFDAIFCRNVAIYMDRPTQMRLWRALERVLDAQGVLFIGHSERIGPDLSDRLEIFGPTSFRRPTVGATPHSPSPEPENVSV